MPTPFPRAPLREAGQMGVRTGGLAGAGWLQGVRTLWAVARAC